MMIYNLVTNTTNSMMIYQFSDHHNQFMMIYNQ